MKVIKNNPYLILGLLVGASAKEQDRQIKRLRQFIEAEQEPEEDFSFPIFTKIERTLENVNDAASKLNLDIDKINAALFWFYNGNKITDEPAFDAIKATDLNQAISIWTKLTAAAEVTQRNCSAFQNLSTLLLFNAFNNAAINESQLEEGILLKLKFLESDFIKELKELATDSTYRATKRELQLLFLNQIHSEIENDGGITSNILIEILYKQEFSAKDDFLKSFVQKLIIEIDKKIEKIKSERKNDKAISGDLGNKLFEETQNDIKQIGEILGVSNPKFQTISDKLANEILQCGIDYFNHFHNSDTDPGDEALALCKIATTFASGNIVKQRCENESKNIQIFVNRKPERDKHKLIANELEFINSKLETFQDAEDSFVNSKDLIDSCKPKLDILKKVLGSEDNFYLEISSTIVNNALQMSIITLNKAFEKDNKRNADSRKFLIGRGFNIHYDSVYGDIQEYKKNLNTKKISFSLTIFYEIEKTLDIFHKLGSFEIKEELKKKYNINFEDIKSIAKQYEISTLGPKEKIIDELKIKENELKKLVNIDYNKSGPYSAELDKNYSMGAALNKLESLKKWHIINRKKKINDQEQWIQEIIHKRKEEINVLIVIKEKEIELLKNNLLNLEY